MIDWAKIRDFKTPAHWERLCDRFGPLRLLDVIFRSCGQILFAEHPLTGASMLLAMAVISAAALGFMVLGAAVSSLSALVLNEDRIYIRRGIFGFNGALLGIFWSWYFLFSTPSLILFILMAAVVAVVQIAMMRLLSYGRYNLPVMSLPAVITLIFSLLLIYWLSYNAGVFSPDSIYPDPRLLPRPLLSVVPATGNVWDFIARHRLDAWTLIFAGIFVNSRISFAAAVFFTGAGLLLLAAPPPHWMPGGAGILLGFNILPLSIALCGLFLVAGLRALLWTALACLVCLGLWLVASRLFTVIHLPLLTLPFNLTVIMALILAKVRGTLRSGVVPVSLDLATTPEKILRSRGMPLDFLGEGREVGRFLRRTCFPRRATRQERDFFLDLIRNARKISILSGAGTSTESGIPDFKNHAVLWKQLGARDLTYENFIARPDIRERYWIMDREFQAIVARARPNEIHEAAKELADQNKLACIVTQNVDGLFQKAGIDPDRVIEVHGSAGMVACLNCGARYPRADIDAVLAAGIRIPSCRLCYGIVKPTTILMGEDLDRTVVEEALRKICASDLLIVVGTSLQVEPVASLPAIARQRGVKIVIIDEEPTEKDELAVLIIRQSGAGFFKRIGKGLMAGRHS